MHMSQDRSRINVVVLRSAKGIHVEYHSWQAEALSVVELRDRSCRCLLGRPNGGDNSIGPGNGRTAQ